MSICNPRGCTKNHLEETHMSLPGCPYLVLLYNTFPQWEQETRDVCHETAPFPWCVDGFLCKPDSEGIQKVPQISKAFGSGRGKKKHYSERCLFHLHVPVLFIRSPDKVDRSSAFGKSKYPRDPYPTTFTRDSAWQHVPHGVCLSPQAPGQVDHMTELGLHRRKTVCCGSPHRRLLILDLSPPVQLWPSIEESLNPPINQRINLQKKVRLGCFS